MGWALEFYTIENKKINKIIFYIIMNIVFFLRFQVYSIHQTTTVNCKKYYARSFIFLPEIHLKKKTDRHNNKIHIAQVVVYENRIFMPHFMFVLTAEILSLLEALWSPKKKRIYLFIPEYLCYYSKDK